MHSRYCSPTAPSVSTTTTRKSFRIPARPLRGGRENWLFPAGCPPPRALVSRNPHQGSSSAAALVLIFNFQHHQLWKSALQQRYTPKKTRDTSQGHKVKLLLTTKYFARRCHDHSRSSNMSCQIFNFPSSVQNNGKLVTVTFPFFHRAPCTFSKISKTGTPKPSP